MLLDIIMFKELKIINYIMEVVVNKVIEYTIKVIDMLINKAIMLLVINMVIIMLEEDFGKLSRD
jgi:hypothetical protein